MASKRRIPNTQGSFRMNFRPPTAESTRCEPPRGTKPTTAPTTVKEIFTLMALHICKKSIFFNTDLKVGIYMGMLFLISLISDFINVPKSYLSRSDNIFNQYFVKFAWGWNLLLLVPYSLLTAYVYCCGQRDRILKSHFPRIIISTCAWFFWTKLFNVIETSYGMCNVRGDAFNTKQMCLKSGYFWHGFDLSGHSFILVYGSLVLIEECRSIMNWESIKDFIRNEDYYRIMKETTLSNNPLRNLSNEQFRCLKQSYDKFTPYIRGLFIFMTILQVLWDVMLVCTMLYYHIMIEKFLGGAIAILTWYATYRYWYKIPKIQPGMPGDGLFKYMKDKSAPPPFPAARKRTGSIVNGNQLPRFMGMPLYGLRNENVPGAPRSAAETQPDESVSQR